MIVARFIGFATLATLFSAMSPAFCEDAVPAPKPGSTFVAKPYLQIGRDPAADRLTVLWHVPDLDAEWSVEHQAKDGDPWTKAGAVTSKRVAVEGTDPYRICRATLSGLTPGSLFNYRVLRGAQPVFTSEAHAPKSADQPYRFVVFGDIGAGTKEQKPVAFQAYQSKPDMVLITGDIVYDLGLSSDYTDKFWPIYNADDVTSNGAPLARSTPMVGAPGNHDIDYRDLDKKPNGLAYYYFWEQPLNGPLSEEGGPLVLPIKANEKNRKAFLDAAGDAFPRMANFSFDYGNAHWTVIDSNPYVDLTSSVIKEWFAKDLAQAKDATWRFVAFHHPGFNSAREHFEQQQMRLLAPVFEEGKVDVVLNGHVHNYQRSYPMKFVPDKTGTLLVAGTEKRPRGRVVNGDWKLDKNFDGKTNTKPEGVIYIVTGAGGQHLYNPEQQGRRDTFQGFTDKFISQVHSLTVADVEGKKVIFRQLSGDGEELDTFTLTK